MSSTPRSGGTLAAQLSHISYNKMLSASNSKPTSAHLNQLMAENATLKHRLNSTIEDLREARDIYERQHNKWRAQYEKMKEALAKRAASAAQFENMQRMQQQQLGGSPDRINSPRARLALTNLYQLDKERHEDALSWNIDMPPWQMAFNGGVVGQHQGQAAAAGETVPAADGSFFADVSPLKAKRSADATIQTDAQRSRSQSNAQNPANDESIPSQLRLINAELLKLQAENVTLRGSVDMLKRDVATDATGQIVRRYEEIASQQIRSLSKALEAANATLTEREREGGLGRANSATRSRRSPSNYSATNSIRPSTAGAMQQMLLTKAREKAKRSGGILGNYGVGMDELSPPSSFRGHPSGSKGRYYYTVPTFSIGTGTDQPWVEAPPSGTYYAHDEGGSRALVSDGAHPQAMAVLQHSLEVAKAQLWQALEELSLAKVAAPLGTVAIMRKRSVDVGTQVSEQGEIERLFVMFHEDYNGTNVERILSNHQNKTAGVLLALTEAAGYTPNEVTKSTLQATRGELITAHEHIEELEFALELERREKQRALDYATSSGRDGSVIAPGEAARQASHEIAFLCDTLSATKIENEVLHERLQCSERERITAIQTLTTLKKRSTDMVKGCQEITEAAKMETEAAMISLLGQVHQKASETSQVRGLLAHAKRSNEDLQGKLDETDKELSQTKAKLFILRDSTAKLREEFNLVTVQLRQLKQKGSSGRHSPPQPFRQLTVNSSNAGGSPRGDDQGVSGKGGSGSFALDSPKEQSVALRSPLAMTAKHASNGDAHEISALELLASETHDSLTHRLASPGNSSFGAASAGSVGARKRAYSEQSATTSRKITVIHTEAISEGDCRSLLGNLLPFAPGAITPNQIVDGVLTSVDLLNDRIGELESEMKLKSGHLMTAKKDVALLQQRIRKMETDKEAAASKLIQKPSVKDRKDLYISHQNEQVLKENLRSIEMELASTKARLFESEKEIEEGRALMLRLIKE